MADATLEEAPESPAGQSQPTSPAANPPVLPASADSGAAQSSSQAISQASSQSSGPISANVLRVLRTRVPLVVTLANKNESAAKVLQYGPGSIIEFDRNCEQPLQLSVNNLPIGFGEAVKIGDHFGLRILSVLPVDERVDQLGGKWAY